MLHLRGLLTSWFRFSGVASATLPDFRSGQVNIIISWPGTGREEGKVPTELFYVNCQAMWGYDVPVDGDPLKWFKLLLVRDKFVESVV